MVCFATLGQHWRQLVPLQKVLFKHYLPKQNKQKPTFSYWNHSKFGPWIKKRLWLCLYVPHIYYSIAIYSIAAILLLAFKAPRLTRWASVKDQRVQVVLSACGWMVRCFEADSHALWLLGFGVAVPEWSVLTQHWSLKAAHATLDSRHACFHVHVHMYAQNTNTNKPTLSKAVLQKYFQVK